MQAMGASVHNENAIIYITQTQTEFFLDLNTLAHINVHMQRRISTAFSDFCCKM